MSAYGKLHTVVTHLFAYGKWSKAFSPERKEVGAAPGGAKLLLAVRGCCFKIRWPRVSSLVAGPFFLFDSVLALMAFLQGALCTAMARLPEGERA